MTEENRNGYLWEAGAQTDGAEEANDGEAAFAAEEQSAAGMPKEVYRFRYTEEELAEVRGFRSRILLRRLAVVVLFFAAALVLANLGSDVFLFAVGMSWAEVIYGLAALFRVKQQWRKELPEIRSGTYEYHVFEDCLIRRVYRNGICTDMHRASFSDVEYLAETRSMLLAATYGQIWMIRKSDLVLRSAVYSLKAAVDAKKPRPMTGWRRTVSVILCIASVLAPFVGLTLMPGLLNLNQYLCVYGLMALIPAVTVLYALLLRRKGYQTRRTMLVGLSMLMGMLFGILAVFFL